MESTNLERYKLSLELAHKRLIKTDTAIRVLLNAIESHIKAVGYFGCNCTICSAIYELNKQGYVTIQDTGDITSKKIEISEQTCKTCLHGHDGGMPCGIILPTNIIDWKNDIALLYASCNLWRSKNEK